MEDDDGLTSPYVVRFGSRRPAAAVAPSIDEFSTVGGSSSHRRNAHHAAGVAQVQANARVAALFGQQPQSTHRARAKEYAPLLMLVMVALLVMNKDSLTSSGAGISTRRVSADLRASAGKAATYNGNSGVITVLSDASPASASSLPAAPRASATSSPESAQEVQRTLVPPDQELGPLVGRAKGKLAERARAAVAAAVVEVAAAEPSSSSGEQAAPAEQQPASAGEAVDAGAIPAGEPPPPLDRQSALGKLRAAVAALAKSAGSSIAGGLRRANPAKRHIPMPEPNQAGDVFGNDQKARSVLQEVIDKHWPPKALGAGYQMDALPVAGHAHADGDATVHPADILVATYYTPTAKFGHFKGCDYSSYLHANRWRYASRHGYQYDIGTQVLDESRPLPWQKVLWLTRWLGRAKWVLLVDADALISGMDKRVEELIREDKDFIFARDGECRGTAPRSLSIARVEWVRILRFIHPFIHSITPSSHPRMNSSTQATASTAASLFSSRPPQPLPSSRTPTARCTT